MDGVLHVFFFFPILFLLFLEIVVDVGYVYFQYRRFLGGILRKLFLQVLGLFVLPGQVMPEVVKGMGEQGKILRLLSAVGEAEGVDDVGGHREGVVSIISSGGESSSNFLVIFVEEAEDFFVGEEVVFVKESFVLVGEEVVDVESAGEAGEELRFFPSMGEAEGVDDFRGHLEGALSVVAGGAEGTTDFISVLVEEF